MHSCIILIRYVCMYMMYNLHTLHPSSSSTLLHLFVRHLRAPTTKCLCNKMAGDEMFPRQKGSDETRQQNGGNKVPSKYNGILVILAKIIIISKYIMYVCQWYMYSLISQSTSYLHGNIFILA